MPRQKGLKTGEKIALQIENAVVRAGWPIGKLLGSEADLIDRYGVSRAAIREAVAILQRDGIVRNKMGRGGGLVVTTPPAESVLQTIAFHLSLNEPPLDEIMEARECLEEAIVGLACRGVSSQGKALLYACADATETADGEAAIARFTRSLAEATGNTPLVLFTECLIRLTAEKFPLVARPRRAAGDIQARQCAIARFVLGQNEARAVRELRAKLKLERDWRAPRGGRSRGNGTPAPAESRVPIMFVRALVRDIKAQNLPVGHHLGTERTLLARYGISRSVFREALRILEQHTIVEVRKGVNGGPVVSKPNPSRTMRKAILYLRAMNLEIGTLTQARRVLETAAGALAARRIDKSGLAILRAALARQAEEKDRLRARNAAIEFYRGVLAMGGNRILDVFAGILVDLSLEAPKIPTHLRVRKTAEITLEKQEKIYEALAAHSAARTSAAIGALLDEVARWHRDAEQEEKAARRANIARAGYVRSR